MRVAVADDSALFRDGLTHLLRDAGITVVLVARSAEELLDGMERHAQDVDAVVLDLRMPPGFSDEGVAAAAAIRRGWPSVGVLLLSTHAEPHFAARLLALDDGGLGYLLKDTVADIAELTAALRRVAAGGTVVDPELVRGLLRARHEDPDAAAIASLTPRQRDVLALMAEGLSNRAIADTLDIAVRTAENHVTAVFTALGLSELGDNRRVRAVLAHLRVRAPGGKPPDLAVDGRE